MNRPTGAELFWLKVEKTDDCWLYTGAKDTYGYGYVGRHIQGKTRYFPAHRYAWAITNGPIPTGMHVLHKCDIRGCVNPSHLFLGTHAENMKDMEKKRRHTFGAKNSHAKITEEQAREIYALKGKERPYEVAKRYGLGAGSINDIWAKRKWKHIHVENVEIRSVTNGSPKT